MKKLFTILTFVILSTSMFAQAPQKMSYQAVIRDNTDKVVINTQVGMQISILQGSVSGTVVYSEIQTPTTNANGLLSIEIGGGTGFDAINWANGPYFIKTETDPSGGTNYTISGTSQLLSVPFALHAKTAESITGTITETDPVYTVSQAANVTATDITNLSNLSGTNSGDQTITRSGTTVTLSNGGSFQDSVNVYTAGTGINIVDNKISATGYSFSYSIGDFAQGGIVFWVDATGQHGLVCAKQDQQAAMRWYAGTYGITHARSDGTFAGKANTAIIIPAFLAIGDDAATYAARVCNELQITEGGVTYGDWYLPSKYELNLMYQNKAVIDATAASNSGVALSIGDYWSSTEENSYDAWKQTFDTGNSFFTGKFSNGVVRAIRSF